MIIKKVEFDQSLTIGGQKAGAVRIENVEGSIGRDGVSLPFVDKDGSDLEALIPWSRIKQVVRAREAKKP